MKDALIDLKNIYTKYSELIEVARKEYEKVKGEEAYPLRDIIADLKEVDEGISMQTTIYFATNGKVKKKNLDKLNSMLTDCENKLKIRLDKN